MELKLDIRPSGLVQFFELLYPVMQMTFGARRKAGHGLGALGGSHPDGFGLQANLNKSYHNN